MYNLKNYDGHCASKTHMSNVSNFTKWFALLDENEDVVVVSVQKPNALHCKVCDLSLSSRGVLFDVGPFWVHSCTNAHKLNAKELDLTLGRRR